LRADWSTAPLSARELTLLRHVDKLTRAPASVTEADVKALQATGFCDEAVFQITAITAFFAYVNRIADGLGLARSGPG
jgi:uncharacterized peroxidase-related enzyme